MADIDVRGSYSATIRASAAATATGNKTFSLPNDVIDGVFFLVVSAVSGTSPTMNLLIETSPDGGTTYLQAFRFAQVTAAATRRLAVAFNASSQNSGSTATNANSGNETAINDGTNGTITTGQLATGCPIVPAYMRLRWVLTATTPSFTFVVYFIGNRAGRYGAGVPS